MNTRGTASQRTRTSQRRGRPPLADPQRIERVLDAVSKGMTYRLAAAFAGVSYDTFNRWRRLSMSDDPPPELCDFCDALPAAEGQAAYRFASRIDEASERDWRAAAWMLERRHPDDWSSNRRELDPIEGFGLNFGL